MGIERMVFVDLETTGADPVRDRITEIGIVEVTPTGSASWSTLVNPGTPIPEFIRRLTGISDNMVADAPPFEAVAGELLERLGGALFVAHNARFDYGFLRNEFRRAGRRFQADVLCTVKLSRKLFPAFHKHNLDSLVERHGLVPQDRHRALADADLLWQFWRHIHEELPAQAIDLAIAELTRRPSLPPQLSDGVVDDLPEGPGVYLFFGENGATLYVGKGVNLRQRVLSHFAADHGQQREMRLSGEVTRLEWRETAGEIGALLLEAELVKAMQPAHNRRLRRGDDLCAWQLHEEGPGDFRPRLVWARDVDFGRQSDLYGLFVSQREARNTLVKIGEAHGLCPVVLGLEKPAGSGRPCFGRQLGRCAGACVGAEPRSTHSARLMSALARLRIKAWPFPGAVGLVERDVMRGREEVHVLDNWCYLGTARSEDDLWALLGDAGHRAAFELDTYKILSRCLAQGKLEIRPLNRVANDPAEASF